MDYGHRWSGAIDHLLDGGDLLAVSELFQGGDVRFDLVDEVCVLVTLELLELSQCFLYQGLSYGSIADGGRSGLTNNIVTILILDQML